MEIVYKEEDRGLVRQSAVEPDHLAGPLGHTMERENRCPKMACDLHMCSVPHMYPTLQ